MKILKLAIFSILETFEWTRIKWIFLVLINFTCFKPCEHNLLLERNISCTPEFGYYIPFLETANCNIFPPFFLIHISVTFAHRKRVTTLSQALRVFCSGMRLELISFPATAPDQWSHRNLCRHSHCESSLEMRRGKQKETWDAFQARVGMGRNAGSRKEGKAEKIPNDIMVQRMSNTASRRLKEFEPWDTRDFVPFGDYDELNIENIKDACERFYKAPIN